MLLYDYDTSTHYTQIDKEIMQEFLASVGYKSAAEQEVINAMCDFIILEKLKIKAMINEPSRTAAQTAEIASRKERVKTIYTQLKKHYKHSAEYIKIRQLCNKIYYNFGGETQ